MCACAGGEKERERERERERESSEREEKRDGGDQRAHRTVRRVEADEGSGVVDGRAVNLFARGREIRIVHVAEEKRDVF